MNVVIENSIEKKNLLNNFTDQSKKKGVKLTRNINPETME
jgi:hypothetical protein